MAMFALMVAMSVAADDRGCDPDSNTGVVCMAPSTRGYGIDELIQSVGSVRDLRRRVASAHIRSATLERKDATYSVDFDRRGRFVKWGKSDGCCWARFGWDKDDFLFEFTSDRESIVYSGTSASCSGTWYDKVTRGSSPQSCTEEGKQLTFSHRVMGERQNVVFAVVENGLKAPPNSGEDSLERDADGKIVRRGATTYSFAKGHTRVVTDGQESLWTLDSAGLPVRTRNYSVKWERMKVVQVIDGTCTEKRCSNPDVDAVIATLSARADDFGLVVEEGAPPKQQRLTTEIWYRKRDDQPFGHLLAKQLKVEAVREWTWGGTFDVLVIVGPKKGP